jgi:hypothetical protein
MLSRKFNRQFVLLIEDDIGEYKQIKSPLTCEFTITRNNLSSLNEAHFVIYNLKESTRNSIYKYALDTWNVRNIIFYAGYSEMSGGMLPRVFKGQIVSCFSSREGSDFRTEIEAKEMWPGLTVDQITAKIPKGTLRSVAIKTVSNMIPDVGAITVSQTGFLDVIKSTMSLIGSPYEILKNLTNNNVYIDSGNVYAVKPKEIINSDLSVIDIWSQNGLLGSPKKFNEKVVVDMIFEPRIKPSQLLNFSSDQDVKLFSQTVSLFNGTYKLTGFIHSGIISGAVNGDCRTTLTLINLKPSGVVIDTATSDYRSLA